jgi:hypothetical protein
MVMRFAGRSILNLDEFNTILEHELGPSAVDSGGGSLQKGESRTRLEHAPGTPPMVYDEHRPRLFPERVPGSERPLSHVYRGVSEEDWQGIQRRGFVKSDGRGNIDPSEGTVAGTDARTAATYAADAPHYRIMRIRVEPEDQWQVDTVDGYIKTNQPVPLDRVEATTPAFKNDRIRRVTMRGSVHTEKLGPELAEPYQQRLFNPWQFNKQR